MLLFFLRQSECLTQVSVQWLKFGLTVKLILHCFKVYELLMSKLAKVF